MDLHLTTDLDGPCPVVGVTGEVDLATAPALREHVEQLGEAGHRHIVLDLAEVSFLDSTGIGALIAIVKHLEPDGRIAIAAAQERVGKVLSLTGLDQLIPVHDTVQAALDAAP